MENLIKALQIFLKYNNTPWPTHCEHDVMMIMGITQEEISEDDATKLDELGFFWSEEYECWSSYKFGSA